MKRTISIALLSLMIFALLAGCSTHFEKSYTFNIENGDQIKVELDIADHYDITPKLPFVISCNGEAFSQGTFILGEYYSQYVDAVKGDPDAKILDSGEKDGNEYIFWNYKDQEFNYVIMVAGSDTGLLIGNNISEESAKECFNRLTITAEE